MVTLTYFLYRMATGIQLDKHQNDVIERLQDGPVKEMFRAAAANSSLGTDLTFWGQCKATEFINLYAKLLDSRDMRNETRLVDGEEPDLTPFALPIPDGDKFIIHLPGTHGVLQFKRELNTSCPKLKAYLAAQHTSPVQAAAAQNKSGPSCNVTASEVEKTAVSAEPVLAAGSGQQGGSDAQASAKCKKASWK